MNNITLIKTKLQKYSQIRFLIPTLTKIYFHWNEFVHLFPKGCGKLTNRLPLQVCLFVYSRFVCALFLWYFYISYKTLSGFLTSKSLSCKQIGIALPAGTSIQTASSTFYSNVCRTKSPKPAGDNIVVGFHHIFIFSSEQVTELIFKLAQLLFTCV